MDLECGTLTPRKGKTAPTCDTLKERPGSKVKAVRNSADVMVMKKKNKVICAGLEAEITETTKYKPPTAQVTARSNIVSPNAKEERREE